MQRSASLFIARAACVGWATSVLFSGCVEPAEAVDDDEATGVGGTGDDDGLTSPGPDMSDVLFDPDRVLDVRIEMAEADWTLLRNQTRSIWDILGGDCLAEPFESPFTYMPADVWIDDELVEHVGVRKKGFLGSLSTVKPSLKVKFHEYEPGQQFLGVRRMTFNNAQQDPSYLNQCLGYALFDDAGIPAPRCNFAHLTVNDEELGLYVHVEAVKQDFLTRHFDDDTGPLYEGTLSDFRLGWTGTFDPKVNESLADHAIIDALTDALEQPDDELLDALSPVLDVDEFLTFWAMEVLVGHWDGYAGNTNNFYVYDDPGTGHARFMPWGIDALFRAQEEGELPESVYAAGRLTRRLYRLPQTRARYVARMHELLDGVWHEDALLAEIERMDAVIDPFAGDFLQDLAVAEIEAFVQARRSVLVDELGDQGPSWNEPEREPMCFGTIGSLDVAFATTFGTLADENWFETGTAEVSVQMASELFEPDLSGAAAGWNPEAVEDGPRVQVVTVSLLDDGDVLVVVVELDPNLVAPGMSIVNDWVHSFALVVRIDSETEAQELLGYLGEGTIELDDAGTDDGDVVVGRIEGELIDVPW